MSIRTPSGATSPLVTAFNQWFGWERFPPLKNPKELARQQAVQLRTSVLVSRSNVFLGMVGSATIATVMAYWSPRQGQPWLWFVLLFAGLMAAAWVIVKATAARPEAPEEILKWRRALLITAVYSSTAWGAAAWLLLPAATNEAATFLIVGIGIVIAGAGAGVVYRPMTLALVLPGSLIFALGLLRLGGTYHALLSLIFLISGAATLWFSKAHESAVLLAIRLGFEVEHLLEESTQQREIADTSRAQAEAALEKADLANKGKTAFLAAAGHDLRQPMHALVQYHADLRRRNADPALNDTLVRVGKSLDAMQDLLDSMLEVSKLLTGSVRPVIRRFAAADLIDGLDAQLRPVAENKGLEFVATSEEAYVETDEVLLERVVRNLTINAVRYTRSGRVVIRCKRRGTCLRIQVWDTGLGIPKTEQEKVFEEFYQVGNDARDPRKGLGLGLALVRQLSNLLGLRLRMRSTPGRGSVFMVDVPLAQGADSTVPASSGGTSADYVRGAFVVLIDDNEASLDSTAGTLRAFGARVLTARSGLEAIERLQNQEFMPQLVISDYRLEHGETGLGAIQTVIENQRALFGDEFEISAMVFSGDTAPQELRAVQAAGHVMLHKPVRPAALYEAANAQLAALASTGIRVCAGTSSLRGQEAPGTPL